MDKRGELTSAQIIAIVLVIFGFAVVLAFIYGFKDSITLNDDICKFSVVGRATAQNLIGGTGQFVPLKCTTKKICITDSLFGGSCSQFVGESDVQTVRLSGTDQQKKEQIESISAEAMYDCWNMMGQGKLDLVSNVATQLGMDSSKSTCVICSRVALDNNINSNILNQIDMNDYLSKTQVPGSSLTYLQTFTDAGVKSFPQVSSQSYKTGLSNSEQDVLSRLQTDATTKLAAYNSANQNYNIILNDQTKSQAQKDAAKAVSDQAKIDSDQAQALYQNVLNVAQKKLDFNFARNETSMVFMQIKSNSLKNELSNQLTLGIAAAGGSFAIAPGKTLGVARSLFSVAGAEVAVVAAAADITYASLNSYESQQAAAGYCGGLTSNDPTAQGCSIVQIMPYSVQDITNLCQVIQGNP